MEIIKNSFSFKARMNWLLISFVAGVLFSLLIPTYLTSAYIPSSFDPGGKNNPIYFQETQDYDTEKRNQNTQTERYLKSAYGISNYYDCNSENESACGIKADTSNPSVQASCLIYIQYCLERKAMNESRSNQSVQNQISCPAGTVARDGACVSNDQACSDKFGQNWKWAGTKNDTGGLNCGCKDGYTSKNGVCVSYDQSCNLSYPNTVFDKIDSAGIRICDCQNGYVWNDQRTSCIVAPVVDHDKQCKEKWPNSSLIGQYCDCGNGYQWNQDRTQCVVVTPKETIIEPETSDSPDDVTKLLKELENLKDTISNLNTSNNQEANTQEKVKSNNFIFNETKVKNFDSKVSTTLKMSAAFRDCPSKGCDVIRYYVEGANAILVAGYDNNDWFKTEMRDDNGSLLIGWMHNSVLNKFEIPNKSKIKDSSYQFSSLSNNTSTTAIERKNSERKSAWKRIKGFFGF